MGVGQHVIFPINHERNALRYTLQAKADQTMMMTERGHQVPFAPRSILHSTTSIDLHYMESLKVHDRLFANYDKVKTLQLCQRYIQCRPTNSPRHTYGWSVIKWPV